MNNSLAHSAPSNRQDSGQNGLPILNIGSDHHADYFIRQEAPAGIREGVRIGSRSHFLVPIANIHQENSSNVEITKTAANYNTEYPSGINQFFFFRFEEFSACCDVSGVSCCKLTRLD